MKRKRKSKKSSNQWQFIIIVAFLAAFQVLLSTYKISPFKPSDDNQNMNNDNQNRELVTKLPQTVYKPYQHKFPCYKGKAFNDKKNKLEGLIYVKVPKTASSTTSGINLRIAYRHANRYLSKEHKKCAATWLHHTSLELGVSKRNKKKTFLWTYIRNTKSIINSNFFFKRRFRKNYTATFAEFKKYAEEILPISKQFRFLATREFDYKSIVDNKSNWTNVIQEILEDYDFIGLTERFDESLVVIRFLLGLDAGDILYVPAKLSGGYDSRPQCNKIPDKIKWPELKEYYNSPEWKRNHALMDEIYAAVNRSLDLTIENIGREKFDKALKEHKYLLELGNKECGPKAIFPCSRDGVYQIKESKKSCYYKDHGCGYACLDELYEREKGRTY